MKHLTLILFVAVAAAQVPRIETRIIVRDRTNTIGTRLDLQVVEGEPSFKLTKATKNRAHISATASTGLFDSYEDEFDSGTGTFVTRLTMRAGSGVVQAQEMLFSDNILSPARTRGFIVPGSGSGTIKWAMPVDDAVGAWCSDGAGNLSIGTCGGVADVVTRTTSQTGTLGITNSKTLYGDGVILNGQSNTSFSETFRLSQNGQSLFELRAWSSSATGVRLEGGTSGGNGNVWTYVSGFQRAGLLGSTIYGDRLMLGTSPDSFAPHRGFEMPSGASGSIYWKLPLSDAAGCLQSNGSATLSISACPGSGGIGSTVDASRYRLYSASGTLVDDWQVNSTGATFYSTLVMSLSGPGTFLDAVKLGYNATLGAGVLTLKSGGGASSVIGAAGFSSINGAAVVNGTCAGTVVFTGGVATSCI